MILIKYIKKYLEGKKKNRILLDLLKFNNEYRQKYPNLVAPIFDYIPTASKVYGLYEKEELESIEKLIKKYCKNKYIIDCGANIGNHTIFFSKFAKKVFAFEPFYLNYECLKLNTDNKKNIKIYNIGLLNKKINKKIYITEGNLGSASVKKRNHYTSYTYAKFNKLDNFNEILKKKNFIIKIDVEDSELELIAGASKVLKSKPIVIFEISDFILNDKFVSLLKKKFGYKFLYVLKKYDLSKYNFFVKILIRLFNILIYKKALYKFDLVLANSTRERNCNSHFAIISSKKLT